MRRFRVLTLVALAVLIVGVGSVTLAEKLPPRRVEPPDGVVGRLPAYGPFVVVQQGDTAWVQVHTDDSSCPGDPEGGHGGEATGGPSGAETWCFENAVWPEDGNPAVNGELVTVSDSCGTNPPWDTRCFSTVDCRTQPSMTNINFWHIDTYLGVNGGELYNGSYCLWCGSDSLWTDGNPVECNIWARGTKPGYGNYWNCIAQLELTGWTTSGTCTLAFDPRYDTECKYDYFYCEYYDGSEWQKLAIFNGSSNSDLTRCGDPSSDNPDYFGFGDTGQNQPPGTWSADWVDRDTPGIQAFFVEIDGSTLPDDPKFRWRVETDMAWSDADGRGNTDGAAMIDNVLVQVDGNVYLETFEDGEWDSVAARGWSLVGDDPVLQAWHQEHDTDRPYEGNDGEAKTTCERDSSVALRARPAQGYAGGQPWRNEWFYRIMGPKIPIPDGPGGTGCVWQFDRYGCVLDYTCDGYNDKVRFWNSNYGKWCPWIDLDNKYWTGGCFFWSMDRTYDLTEYYSEAAESMQVCWEVWDISEEGDFCRGKHKWTDHIVDNVSVGFYDGTATQFRLSHTDLLLDSFHDSLCAFNSIFEPSTYRSDSLEKYAVPGGEPMRKREQFYAAAVTDKDGITDIRLYGSLDGGNTWIYNTLTQDLPADPDFPAGGGSYYAGLCPDDFGFVHWPIGSEIWYYVWVEDQLGNIEYWPSRADPDHPDHEGTEEDYADFAILPRLDPAVTGKILLTTGHNPPYGQYDYAECLASLDSVVATATIYEEVLADAGYCFDTFNILGGGSNRQIHPIEFADHYDCLLWCTGPYFDGYLFDKEAQVAIQSFMAEGGKIILAGDRIAYCMDVNGEDSLGGEFLNGIMGCDYLGEMEAPFDKPYAYLEAAETVYVHGDPVPIPLDSLLIYRECPYLKDMSYVIASSSPDTGYVAQSLLYCTNYDPTVAPNGADGAIYVEKTAGDGQCVYINYDLGAFATHEATYCDGIHPADPNINYQAGYYYGRVDLIRTILEDLFGLEAPGGAGVPGRGKPPVTQFRWALEQNTPNPVAGKTEIRFEVARTSDVSIKVYNAMGQLVRTLKNERMQPGRHSVHWDGANASGKGVSSGVYFYKMEAGKFQATRKMLILK